jgi:hypothetical protein
VTLGRPRWWAIALAGFLLRGGVVVATLPIVVIPSIAGASNWLGPLLTPFLFGEPSGGLVLLAVLFAAALGIWVAASANVGAWLDLELIGHAAADEDLGHAAEQREDTLPARIKANRAGAVRLLAHVPTATLFALAAPRLFAAGYSELIGPGDPAIPLLLRVVGRAPEAVAIVAIAWLIGEAAGGIAARRLVLGDSVVAAVTRGFAALLRPSGLATVVATNVVLGAVLALDLFAVSLAWQDLRLMLAAGEAPSRVVASLGLFLVTWVAGLGLIALATAWRSVAWTGEVLRASRAVAHSNAVVGPVSGG